MVTDEGELFRKGRNGPPRAREKARMPFHYRKLVPPLENNLVTWHARNG